MLLRAIWLVLLYAEFLIGFFFYILNTAVFRKEKLIKW